MTRAPAQRARRSAAGGDVEHLPYLVDQPDHFARNEVAGTETDALADRILAGPEPPRERLVDHHDGPAFGAVLGRELTAALDAHAKKPERAWGEREEIALRRTRLWVIERHHRQPQPATSHHQWRRSGAAGDARDRRRPREQRLDEAPLPRLRIPSL